MRDGAVAAIASGNPLESVAAVYGVAADTLQAWVRQDPVDVPGQPQQETVRPWLSFPGTVIYPNGLARDRSGLELLFWIGTLLVLALANMKLLPDRWEVTAGITLFALACIGAAMRVIQCMRVDHFEMLDFARWTQPAAASASAGTIMRLVRPGTRSNPALRCAGG